MRPYACYPKTRAYYRAPFSGFVNPYFTQTTNDVNKRQHVANRPSANIIRSEMAYKIELAVPGLNRDDIHIELKDDQLIITGSQKQDQPAQKMVRSEFDYAGFKRVFRLHANADTAAMTAEYHAGILTIVIPDKTPVTTQIHIQ